MKCWWLVLVCVCVCMCACMKRPGVSPIAHYLFLELGSLTEPFQFCHTGRWASLRDPLALPPHHSSEPPHLSVFYLFALKLAGRDVAQNLKTVH